VKWSIAAGLNSEGRSFGRLGLQRRRAERRGWRPFLGACRVWRYAAVFLDLVSAGLAFAPICARPSTG
jgi:hypothetical protein